MIFFVHYLFKLFQYWLVMNGVIQNSKYFILYISNFIWQSLLNFGSIINFVIKLLLIEVFVILGFRSWSFSGLLWMCSFYLLLMHYSENLLMITIQCYQYCSKNSDSDYCFKSFGLTLSYSFTIHATFPHNH